MTSIFISHSHHDTELAKIFFDFLVDGLGVNDKGIYCHSLEGYATDIGDDNYVAHITNSLRSKKILLVLLTQEYLDSHFCTYEFGIAKAFNQTRKKNITKIIIIKIPQLLKEPHKLHDFMVLHQKCDISNCCSKLKENIVNICTNDNLNIIEEDFLKQTIEFNNKASRFIIQRENEQENDFFYIMENNPLFSDVKETVKLINDLNSRTTHIKNLEFFGDAKLVRENSNCQESRYVLPLTDLTLKFFTCDDNSKNWFEEERNLKHERDKRRRVVIIDNTTITDNGALSFLDPYKDLNWRIIPRSDLINKKQKCMIRDFCIFEFNNTCENVAYFTYLDQPHENLFIKGSWSQYKTFDTYYIFKLIDHFEYLWKLSANMPIEKYTEILKKIVLAGKAL